MDATRIIAVRHGETAWNVDTRIQGHLDIPLNDTGHWQARRLAAALADEPLAAVYASDLGRAHATAQAVASAAGLPVLAEPALRERAFGRFEGQTFAEIEAQWPEDALRWRRRDPDFAPPEGGESLITFRDRIVAAAHAIAARHPGEQIMLVGHGGVMDVLYRAATGQELGAPRSWALGNAAINRLLWTPDGLTLVGWADTRHLDETTLDESTA
ncbi:MAG: histidine phosphatase family protein [Burkholderiales bacterium]|jgi:probable phosphoglycerate mutase|nr:histidine phosphatase family protein [Burkholderiales bacterium]